jgi:hypothetical protein
MRTEGIGVHRSFFIFLGLRVEAQNVSLFGTEGVYVIFPTYAVYELFGCTNENANINEIELRMLPAGIDLNELATDVIYVCVIVQGTKQHINYLFKKYICSVSPSTPLILLLESVS